MWVLQDSSVPNGNPTTPFAEGMQGGEVDRRLNQAVILTCSNMLYYVQFSALKSIICLHEIN